MKYFRLIFKVEDNQVMFSDLIEQEVEEDQFENMIWDKPIIRHEVGGHVHYIALDRDYLEAMLLGIGTYQELIPKEETCKKEKCCKE
tara:strand:- start:289 stop:549 length:261 start_codon:yes stop_codon:yes gene_type:complete